MPTRRDILCKGGVLLGFPALAGRFSQSHAGQPQAAAGAGAALQNTTAPVNALADDLLAHLKQTSTYVQLKSGMRVTDLDDLSFDAARREAAFNREMLARVDRILQSRLSHDQWLLAKILRQRFVSRARAEDDYWFEFLVTPYSGGTTMSGIHQLLASLPLRTMEDLDNYVHLLEIYVHRIDEIGAKLRAQAARGIRLPKPAIGGALATLKGLKASAAAMLVVNATRLEGLPSGKASAFSRAVDGLITGEIARGYEGVSELIDSAYQSAAPEGVGLSQYPGGEECYARLITAYTGLMLTPQQIHARGLAAVQELEQRMQAIRAKLGFRGTREEFHDLLRKDPRFLAKTPQEVEERYLGHLRRVEPHIPRYFSALPKAPYGVKRLDPGAEAGMTYGYYQAPTPLQPTGYYRYNASDLANRSLVSAAHLIYHELVPGHHFHVALEAENTQVHPVRQFLSSGAFNEGWAEYAANLAIEMGALDDPYDRYGHLLMQGFIGARLVVDTGMNCFGWPLGKAREYLKDHSFESDTQIASESLRYSTDIPAQALSYRLGYEKFAELRELAQRTLGARFDIRAFHAAIVGHGAMPMDVLDEHIRRFVSQGA